MDSEYFDHHSGVILAPLSLRTDGIVSYSLEDGEHTGRGTGLQDVTYDGKKTGAVLTGGLGQLTDGEIGHTNYRVDYSGKKEGEIM